jgi:hypothetical protein
VLQSIASVIQAMPVEQEIPAVEVSPTSPTSVEANNRWQAIINPINENLYTALRTASNVCSFPCPYACCTHFLL